VGSSVRGRFQRGSSLLAAPTRGDFVQHRHQEGFHLRRWLAKDQTDIRDDIPVTEEAQAFITEAGAKSVVVTDRIIGCPHEEGIDYEGATCPVLLVQGRAGPLDRQTPALDD
jgi:hypothetical protein